MTNEKEENVVVLCRCTHAPVDHINGEGRCVFATCHCREFYTVVRHKARFTSRDEEFFALAKSLGTAALINQLSDALPRVADIPGVTPDTSQITSQPSEDSNEQP
jgi:hypothetical protein